MIGRTIAIGDVHGCAAALAALLEAIDPQPQDRLVPLGDYIDRGPDSAGVIELMIKTVEQCELIPLLGNHELMMLASLESLGDLTFWLRCGGAATLESYGGDLANIPESHLTFLRHCRPYYETDKQLFFHANYDPRLSPQEQPEGLLFWEHLMMYPDGRNSIPGPHHSGKTVFVGHTPQESGQVLDLDHVICIDTFCVGSGFLTAIDVETRQIWQADKDGKKAEGERRKEER